MDAVRNRDAVVAATAEDNESDGGGPDHRNNESADVEGTVFVPGNDGIAEASREESVIEEAPDSLADNHSFLAHEAGHRRGGHHVVDADHVACGPAHRLQGDDPGRIDPDFLARVELEEGEHHVAHRVGTGHEGPEAANEGRKDGPCASCQGGHSGGEDFRHLGVAGSSTVGVDEDLYHGNGEDKSDGSRHRGLEG